MAEQEPHPPPNDVCSICHGTFQIPCQANCSHWFCANCILLVWRHTSGIQPCKCPLCRRPINLLVPSPPTDNRDDSNRILSEIQIYNRTFGLQSDAPFAQRILDLPFLLRRLFRDFVNPNNSLPLVIKARVFLSMIVSVIYIVSPIDIIPEGIFGVIGFLDDVLVALLLFLHVATLYRSVLYRRHGGA